MGISQYDPAAAGRPAWNAGRQVGAKRALKIRQIWSIRFFLDREGWIRSSITFKPLWIAAWTRTSKAAHMAEAIGRTCIIVVPHTEGMSVHIATRLRPLQFGALHALQHGDDLLKLLVGRSEIDCALLCVFPGHSLRSEIALGGL